jgi:peptidyl-prolyl cis-trans isomerase SurA
MPVRLSGIGFYVKHDRRRAVTGRLLGMAALIAVATAAVAQQPAATAPNSAENLDIPADAQIFGKFDPDVRKPTAIVNETVITGTDVDQRVGLIRAANPQVAQLPPAELDRLKLQVLRQLIDETLQIQEAKSADITITADELKQSYNGVARNFNRTPAQMAVLLRESGSSDRSLRRQIEGELAWQRYLRRKVEPFVNIGDAEVKAILDRLEASKGTEEFNLREIYLSANDATKAQVFATARQLIAEIQKGQQPFGYFARQYSEASTRGVEGDLGWVRAAQLPAELAAAAQQMQVGQVAGPIEIPGGYSIVYLTDKRQVLTADPRDARLSLKQLTLPFPAKITQAEASARAAAFGKALQQIQGCGTVEKIAASVNAEVVDNDTVRARDLPPQLADIMLQLQVGQSSPPFGSAEQGVRALVLCGRDDPKGGQLPSSDQVETQLQQQRVNLRAQQKLRDLRRDAVVEYR